MLRAGGRAPRPLRPPGSPSRFAVVGIGIAVVLGFTLLFFSLRGGNPEPAAPRGSTRGSRETREERMPVPARPPRRSSSESGREESARRPSASAVAAKAALGEPPELKPGDVSDPALKNVLSARDDRSPSGTDTLIDGLGSSDEIVVAEAAKALVAREATGAIAPLAAISLEKAAGSGLSVIDALGKLGGVAEGDEKNAAVERLLKMLREEKLRRAPESPGNLLQIYEALGDTRDPKAAPALEGELLDASVPRAPKVVIVHALVDVGLASSKDALGAARADQAAQQGSDAFEEEIRRELVATLGEALEAL